MSRRRLSPLARLLRDVGGASAVEFAMILTPMCLIFFGVLEFGRAMWVREALQEAATAGARCVGIPQSQCASGGTYNSANAISYIQGVASGWGITLPSADITLNASTTCAGLAGFATVTIAYNFQTVVPKLVPFGTGGITLNSQACFPN
jgi:Flp pilus assembly protein TadG